MSVVVLVRRLDEAVIAADSFCQSGPLACDEFAKIVDCGAAWIGFSGDAVIADALDLFFADTARRDLYAFGPTAKRNIFEWALAFRRFCKDALHLVGEKPAGDDGNFAHIGASFLILDKASGAGWWVEGDLGVTAVEDVWAIGEGRQVALGAMRALNLFSPRIWERPTCENFAAEIAQQAVTLVCEAVKSCALPVHLHDTAIARAVVDDAAIRRAIRDRHAS